jgi:thiamine-phosphate pyrophosphorylase
MDARLVGWARAVKRRLRGGRSGVPVLWLFTDAARLADPLAAAAALPRGLCGVVLRDDAAPGRQALAVALARICRARGNELVVAGDARLARSVGAGVHLRGGRRLRGMRGAPGIVTSSAHGVAELRAAARAGARVAFLSPAFATPSHKGAPGLGPVRWGAMARRAAARLVVGALGGMSGASVRRLPGLRCAAAIGALAAR